MFMRGQLGFLVIDALSRIINSNKKGEKKTLLTFPQLYHKFQLLCPIHFMSNMRTHSSS